VLGHRLHSRRFRDKVRARAFTVAESTLRAWGLEPREYLLVGRDVFREFLGDPSYYERAIDLIRSLSGEIDIFELVEKKIKELTEDIRKHYGDDIARLLRELS